MHYSFLMHVGDGGEDRFNQCARLPISEPSIFKPFSYQISQPSPLDELHPEKQFPVNLMNLKFLNLLTYMLVLDYVRVVKLFQQLRL